MFIQVDPVIHFALVKDTASGSDALMAQSVLEPSTGYTLYGMEGGLYGLLSTEEINLDSGMDPLFGISYSLSSKSQSPINALMLSRLVGLLP